MDSAQSFLRMIDIFGLAFTFRYKGNEKYQSAIGGFIFIIFLILALAYCIYYFIPFVNRKNYTVVYYTMNLASAEEMNLFSSDSNFAFGLRCGTKNTGGLAISDLFKIDIKYTNNEKYPDGSRERRKKTMTTHSCTYEDFYNKYNEQFDYLGLSNFQCLDSKEDTIQGIYTDKIYSYFEFEVAAKNNSKEVLDRTGKYIYDNGCEFEIVYTDVIVDLNNYESPFTPYLTDMYVTLNPPVFIKRNAFFLNQYFSNDDYLLFVFGDDETPSVKPLFSRYEEYSIWKGLNRSEIELLPDDYTGYARVYIRSDLKKTLIKRKYQNFLEFWADATSLLMAIYEVVSFILSYINTFYSNHSLAQNIFFFKNLENENHFNINKKKDEIQKLIYLMNSNSDIENLTMDIISNNSKDISSSSSIKSFPPKRTEENIDENKEAKNDDNFTEKKDKTQKKKIEDNIEINNMEDIIVYKNQPGEKSTKDNSTIKKGRYNQNRNEYNNRNQKNKKYDIYDNYEYPKNKNYDDFGEYYAENAKKVKFKNEQSRDMNSDLINLNFRRNEQNIYKSNSSKKSKRNNRYEDSDDSSYRRRERKKKEKIYYSFNIFEILITQIFKCCMSKSMKIKNKANEKANEIIFNKLDVIYYVRNMILSDIIYQTILDNEFKPIMKTLSRPIININSKKGNDSYDYDYSKKDFNEFCEHISELYKKENKEDKELKLISISNRYLRSFI